MQNPFVFVVGCPRSGTTLLQRMLDSHPQLAVANDTHFIPRAIENEPAGSNPVLTEELIQRVRSYHRFPRLGLPDAEVDKAADGSRSYREFVSALYAAYASLHGKAAAGEKTPDYVRLLPRLQSLFPWARIVHILRDGRNVALSTLQWARADKGPGRFQLWKDDPVAVCALWWRWQVSSGRGERARLGPQRYCEVYYEELVENPEPVLRQLCNFLELPYAGEMLEYHAGKTRYEPGLSAKSAYLPPVPGLRDWRTQMDGRDVVLFEALAGDLLGELGYPPGTPEIASEIAAIASLRRSQWEAELARRQAKKRLLMKNHTKSEAA